jgi:hypothetical protein
MDHRFGTHEQRREIEEEAEQLIRQEFGMAEEV